MKKIDYDADSVKVVYNNIAFIKKVTSMKRALLNLFNKLTDREKKFRFTSVKSFCIEEGNKYKVLAKEQKMEELRPCIWKIRENPEIYIHDLPETYIAEIENATVFGENDVIVSKGVVLSDEFTHIYADKMQLDKRITKKIDLKHREVELLYHNYRKIPIEVAFNLVGIFPFSYYHFVINLLPKLYYLQQCDEYRDVPLLVDKRAYSNFKKIIDLYNVHNRPIICVGADTAFKVRKLIVTSNCAWYDRYVLEHYFSEIGHVYDKLAMRFVRDYALSLVDAETEKKRVYVSRRKQDESRRRLADEDKVEALFNKYGFISVFPEELSFLEQVKLFSQTEVFAGTTGAAFTNIIFLPENATVIYSTCVCNNTGENLFPSLWHSVGKGKFITLQGEVTEETKNMKDNLRKFKLNLQEIEELLRTL